MSSSDYLTKAIDHHRAGRVSDAERLYRHVLQHSPRDPDALHLPVPNVENFHPRGGGWEALVYLDIHWRQESKAAKHGALPKMKIDK